MHIYVFGVVVFCPPQKTILKEKTDHRQNQKCRCEAGGEGEGGRRGGGSALQTGDEVGFFPELRHCEVKSPRWQTTGHASIVYIDSPGPGFE